MDYAAFVSALTDAYEHLYDLVHLRTHALTPLLVRDPNLNRKESAWELQRLLLAVIEEIDPGPQAPVTSREWRRHRLLELHYADGLTAQAVSDQLAISRRHYYRELEVAIDALAQILWDRFVRRQTITPESPAADNSAMSRLELLRSEASRAAHMERYERLTEIVSGVHAILNERLEAQGVQVLLQFPESMPNIAVESHLLRQLLMAAVGFVADVANRATLNIRAEYEAESVLLTLSLDQTGNELLISDPRIQSRLDSLREVASLSNLRTITLESEMHLRGFQFVLPVQPQDTVLVVDDNEDTLSLIQRYLNRHNYRVVVTRTAEDALGLARQLQPVAVTIDLMMPDIDGWELLQTLRHQPETQAIPIVVCSILRQQELALSLGATAFLEKPVTEDALVELLMTFRRSNSINV